jgi:hypothetical protein
VPRSQLLEWIQELEKLQRETSSADGRQVTKG